MHLGQHDNQDRLNSLDDFCHSDPTICSSPETNQDADSTEPCPKLCPLKVDDISFEAKAGINKLDIELGLGHSMGEDCRDRLWLSKHQILSKDNFRSDFGKAIF